MTIAICGGTCALLLGSVLFFPRLKKLDTYPLAALLGAVLLLATGQLSGVELLGGLLADRAVNPLKILTLFLSMTFLSVYMDEAGFFRIAAAWAAAKAGANQKKLFFYLFAAVSVLTVFTSNDVIVLTFTPFICYFTAAAGIDPLPYLFSEFVAANTWSMALLIGNPTNIYLASAKGIGFFKYASVMWLPALLAGLTALLVLFLLFRKKLAAPMHASGGEFPQTDPVSMTEGLTILLLCTTLLAVSPYTGLEMWVEAFACALLLLVLALAHGIKKHNLSPLRHAAERVPWQLVPFMLAMFTLVLALQKHGVTAGIAGLLGQEQPLLRYGGFGLLASNLINNIPMSVLASGVLENLSGVTGEKATYAVIAASNIGAFLTPVGALAGMMWTGMLKKLQVKLSFGRFICYGTAAALPAFLAAIGGLWLIFC